MEYAFGKVTYKKMEKNLTSAFGTDTVADPNGELEQR